MSSMRFSRDAADLEPVVISIALCRALRIRRVGMTFFVENNQPVRDGDDQLHDYWKVVAVIKPDHKPGSPSAWDQAHQWLWSANEKVMDIANEARARAAASRGAD